MYPQYLDPKTVALVASAKPIHYQIAAAMATAYAAPLPSSPVQSGAAYFDTSVKEAVAKVMEFFNEVRPVDYTSAVENTKAFWLARYAVAHGLAAQQISQGPGLSSSALTLFGIAYNLPQELLNEVTTCAVEIQPVYARISADMLLSNLFSVIPAYNQAPAR